MHRDSTFITTSFFSTYRENLLCISPRIVSRDTCTHKQTKKKKKGFLFHWFPRKAILSFWTLIFLHPGRGVPLPIIIVDRGEISLCLLLGTAAIISRPTDINHTLPQKRKTNNHGAGRIASSSSSRNGLRRMPAKLSCRGLTSHRALILASLWTRSICVIDVQKRQSLYRPWRLIGRVALESFFFSFFNGEMTRVRAWSEMRQEVGWTCRSEGIPATRWGHANPHPVFVCGAQCDLRCAWGTCRRDREICYSCDIFEKRRVVRANLLAKNTKPYTLFHCTWRMKFIHLLRISQYLCDWQGQCTNKWNIKK